MFTNTVSDRWMSDGKFYEKGTYFNDGGSTGGLIAPATFGNGISAGIREIYSSDFDADSGDVTKTYGLGKKNVTIATAANAVGFYELSGFGA